MTEAKFSPAAMNHSEWIGEPGTEEWADICDAEGNVVVILRGTWHEGPYIDFGPNVLLRTCWPRPHRGFEGS